MNHPDGRQHRLDDSAGVLAMLTGRRCGLMRLDPASVLEAERQLRRQISERKPVIVETLPARGSTDLPYGLAPVHPYEITDVTNGIATLVAQCNCHPSDPDPLPIGILLDHIHPIAATILD